MPRSWTVWLVSLVAALAFRRELMRSVVGLLLYVGFGYTCIAIPPSEWYGPAPRLLINHITIVLQCATQQSVDPV